MLPSLNKGYFYLFFFFIFFFQWYVLFSFNFKVMSHETIHTGLTVEKMLQPLQTLRSFSSLGLRSVHLTNSSQRIWHLKSYETTNPRNSELCREPIMETLTKRKWNWAGHMARRTDYRLKSRIAIWTPYGHTRNRGKPRTRWRDDLLL